MSETRKPRTARSAKATTSKTAPKRSAKATEAAKTRRANASAAKGKAAPGATVRNRAAKATAPTAPREATGPTPERIKLAATVAKLRDQGVKWNEIAATTGKSEGALAKLRKDVRAGKFAKVSPAASRVSSDAF